MANADKIPKNYYEIADRNITLNQRWRRRKLKREIMKIKRQAHPSNEIRDTWYWSVWLCQCFDVANVFEFVRLSFEIFSLFSLEEWQWMCAVTQLSSRILHLCNTLLHIGASKTILKQLIHFIFILKLIHAISHIYSWAFHFERICCDNQWKTNQPNEVLRTETKIHSQFYR